MNRLSGAMDPFVLTIPSPYSYLLVLRDVEEKAVSDISRTKKNKMYTYRDMFHAFKLFSCPE